MDYIDEQGVQYLLNPNDHTAEIVKITKDIDKIEFSRSINYNKEDYVITTIGSNAITKELKKSLSFAPDSALKTIKVHGLCLSRIQNLSIPASLETIAFGTFRETISLVNISISPKNKNFIYLNNQMILGKSDPSNDTFDVLYFVRRDATKVILPSFVTAINDFAFDGCDQITDLEIGKDSELCSIEYCAFANSSIRKLYFPPKVRDLHANWCQDTENLIEIKISKDNENFSMRENKFVLGKVKCNKYLFNAIYFAPRNIENVKIPSFVRFIQPCAFDYCLSLSKVEFDLEDPLLFEIGPSSFYRCPIQEICIPRSVSIIDEYAFCDTMLRKVTFDKGSKLRKIKSSAFSTTQIKTISIPSSVEKIYDSAFSFTPIQYVEFGEESELRVLDRQVFTNTFLMCLSLPSTMRKIGSMAFYDCTYLHMIELNDDPNINGEDKIVYIHKQAFQNSNPDMSIFVGINRFIYFFTDAEEQYIVI